jgi:hypothetical protein
MKTDLKDKLLEALEKSLGIVTPACKEVGISRNTFYTWYKEDIDFKKRVDDINDITLDFAENQLLRKIKEGSERSILFYMKYKARHRGYNEELNINANVKVEQPLLLPLKKSSDDDLHDSN